MYLEREYIKRDEKSPFEYHDFITYKSLTLRQKVLILYFLCEMQFDRPDLFKPVTEVPELEARHWVVVIHARE